MDVQKVVVNPDFVYLVDNPVDCSDDAVDRCLEYAADCVSNLAEYAAYPVTHCTERSRYRRDDVCIQPVSRCLKSCDNTFPNVVACSHCKTEYRLAQVNERHAQSVDDCRYSLDHCNDNLQYCACYRLDYVRQSVRKSDDDYRYHRYYCADYFTCMV